MTVRKQQRWEPTKAALARRDVLLDVASGDWHTLAVPLSTRPAAYSAVIELERRGLLEVDRRDGRIVGVRAVLPEQKWLASFIASSS